MEPVNNKYINITQQIIALIFATALVVALGGGLIFIFIDLLPESVYVICGLILGFCGVYKGVELYHQIKEKGNDSQTNEGS